MEKKVSRIGLTLLHEPALAADAEVDIVFVHGLFGHPYKTWTCKEGHLDFENPPNDQGQVQRLKSRFSLRRALSPKSSISSKNLQSSRSLLAAGRDLDSQIITSSSKFQDVFWPYHLLPRAVPGARIFTWGYDVDISRMFSFASQSTVLQHAETLLSDILDVRGDGEAHERNLIFVAHSLGGIVVKDALCLSMMSQTRLKRVLHATMGICFLGTPHRGSSSASVGKIAFNISKIFYTHANTAILQTLENNGGILDRISRNFGQLIMGRDIQIQSFRETLPTKGYMIVDAESAIIGEGREITGEIPSNHRDMTKYVSSRDIGYRRVSNVLARWVHEMQQQLQAVNEKQQRECLNSLDFPESRQRIATVDTTFEGTCEWLFEKDVKFIDWLRRRQDDIYWIQGKPGSGKSTVMKLAMSHKKTTTWLKEADSKPWLIAGFFFHDRGFLAQKTVDGLLREILYQLLLERPQLYTLLQLLYTTHVRSKPPNTAETRGEGNPEIIKVIEMEDRSAIEKLRWTRDLLVEALLAIVSNHQVSLNICLFIDALDEHEGDHRNLMSTLKDLVRMSNRSMVCVKLCLASRPENIFRDELSTYPGFAIQEYTKEDILIYASGRMHPELARRKLHKNLPQINRLLQNILEMAQGVFIWVRLVVDELIEGLCEGDNVDDLVRLLSTIPSELEGLYRRALGRLLGRRTSKPITDRRTYEAFVMFQIALCAWQPYSLERFIQVTSFITDGSYGCGGPVLRAPVPTDDMERRIISRGGGLLECIPSEKQPLPAEGNILSSPESDGTLEAFDLSMRKHDLDPRTMTDGAEVVQFIHQTAKEFVLQENTASIILQNPQKYLSENGHDFILRYCTYLLKNGQVSIVPEMLYQIWSSFRKGNEFKHSKAEILMPFSASFSFSRWNPMTKSAYDTFVFAEFWYHMGGDSQRLLLIAVCAFWIPYIETALPATTLSAKEATAIFYAAIYSSLYPWPGMSKGDTTVFKLLLAHNIELDPRPFGITAGEILDTSESGDPEAVARLRVIVGSAGL